MHKYIYAFSSRAAISPVTEQQIHGFWFLAKGKVSDVDFGNI